MMVNDFFGDPWEVFENTKATKQPKIIFEDGILVLKDNVYMDDIATYSGAYRIVVEPDVSIEGWKKEQVFFSTIRQVYFVGRSAFGQVSWDFWKAVQKDVDVVEFDDSEKLCENLNGSFPRLKRIVYNGNSEMRFRVISFAQNFPMLRVLEGKFRLTWNYPNVQIRNLHTLSINKKRYECAFFVALLFRRPLKKDIANKIATDIFEDLPFWTHFVPYEVVTVCFKKIKL